jgi:hypothetical protein
MSNRCYDDFGGTTASRLARRSRLRSALCAAGLLVALSFPLDAAAADITLAWDASPGTVAGYTIYYGTSTGSYTASINVGNQTSRKIEGLSYGVRYFFVVKAYSATGLLSSPTNEVNGLAGPLLSFTDDPLVPRLHVMKAVHMTELRNSIDALRARRSLPAYPWTAIAPGTMVRASHITELRNALSAEYVGRGFQPPSYTDTSLNAGMSIKESHISQLREFVIDLQ